MNTPPQTGPTKKISKGLNSSASLNITIKHNNTQIGILNNATFNAKIVGISTIIPPLF